MTSIKRSRNKKTHLITVIITALLIVSIAPYTCSAYSGGSGTASVPGQIYGWGLNSNGQATPPAGNDYKAIAAGGYHNIALRSDGSVVGWGYNGQGQATPPAGNDYIAITAGLQHNLALKSDGSIVGWGSNYDSDNNWAGQATPPAGNDYIAISAGWYHNLALKSDGSIVGWGLNNYGQATPPAGNDYIAIAAGYSRSLALKSDGSIVGWGVNNKPPADNDYIAIAAGMGHSIALKSDGSIAAWGLNDSDQTTAPTGTGFIAIAAGERHSLALKSDGSIVAWGANGQGQATPPIGTDFNAIAAGRYHSLAIKPVTYTLNVSVVGGHGTVSLTSGSYDSSTVVTLTASPDIGYRVKAWVGTKYAPSVGSNNNSVKMDADKTVTVEFEQIPPYAYGDGTAGNPYQVWTSQQMNTIGADPGEWNKCFMLMADIDMSAYAGSTYNIIGNYYSNLPFTGSFDGNGHKIRNLSYTTTTAYAYVGLFAFAQNATIKNLGLENVNISTAGGYAGGLVGYQSAGTITNCYSTGLITTNSSENSCAYAGGLVGYQLAGTITSCYSAVSVSSSSSSTLDAWGSYAGGLVGYQFAGTITDCHSTGAVASSPSSYWAASYAGGLVGYQGNTNAHNWDLDSGSITNCYSTGKVTSSSSWNSYAGGLVAYQESGTTSNCSSTGSVSSSSSNHSNSYYVFGSYAGGLVGYQYGTIANCYSMGSVNSSSDAWGSYAGGLVGWQDGNLMECYSVGSVTSSYSHSSSCCYYSYAGGLVGCQEFGTTTSCYSTGSVSSSSSSSSSSYFDNSWSCAGGLVGCKYSGTITSCLGIGSATSDSSSSSSASCYSYAGGLVGEQDSGIITNSYGMGSVASSSPYYSYAGGLVGFQGDSAGAKTEKCYSTGQVSAAGYYVYEGGLLGYAGASGTVVACFWDTQTSGLTTSDGGSGALGKTTAEMQMLLTFTNAGWDFVGETVNGTEDIWTINQGIDYPKLMWESTGNLRITLGPAGAISIGAQWNIDGGPWRNSGATVTGLPPGSHTVNYKSIIIWIAPASEQVAITIGQTNSISRDYKKQTSLTYSGGSGTATDPYLISTPEDLISIGAMTGDLGKCFKLMADINMSAYTGTQYNIIGDSTTKFTGTFDGNGHIVRNLTYTTTDYVSYVGMFGYSNGATIKNLGIEDANFSTGGVCAGGLVGYQGCNTTITNCYIKGSVSALTYAGGLVGYQDCDSTITNCYSEGSVTSLPYWDDSYAGGLVGYQESGAITNCYSTCSVTSSNGNSVSFPYAGGLVGYQESGTITACYSTGSVMSFSSAAFGCYAGGLAGYQESGAIMACYSMSSVNSSNYHCNSASYAGGLVGGQECNSTITNSYSSGAVITSGSIRVVGGLVGVGGYVFNSFWDIQTSGLDYSAGGNGRNTTQMKQSANYIVWNTPEQAYWTINEGVDYPRLAWQNQPGTPLPIMTFSDIVPGAGTISDPYRISTSQQLNTIGSFPDEWNKIFVLENDIDLSSFTGTEFNRIGVSKNKSFGGTFDGNGHVIRNLTYNTTSGVVDYVGLFGYSNGAIIKNLGVEDGKLSTKGICAGGLVGHQDYGSISNCYSTGSVSSGIYAGGLVGEQFSGTTTNCYSTGSVISYYDGSYAGGLVGKLYNGAIMNCYSTSSVTSDFSISEGDDSYAGGLLGYQSNGTIASCYSTGSVMSISCSTSYAGGLLGYQESGNIMNCYSKSLVTSSTYYYILDTPSHFAGGLVGKQASGYIGNCYSTGVVAASGSGDKSVGGLAGSGGSIANSFWDTTKSGLTTSAGGIGKTTAQMKKQSTFTIAGWDFVGETINGIADIWSIKEGADYPKLTWQSIIEQQTGNLQVTLTPAAAISAGAQWNVDGGTWRNSGATVTGLSVGSHTVNYKSITGWDAPSSESVSITNSQTNSISRDYMHQTKFGSINGKTVNLPFQDLYGVNVTFGLTGGGYGEIIGGANFDQIILYGTSEKSQLTISTKGTTEISIGSIIANGPLKVFSAKTTNLCGDITVNGSLGTLTLNDVADNHTITIGSPAIPNPKAAVTIVLDRVSDLTIDSGMPIKSISVTEWLVGSIDAPSIGSITTKGDKKRGIAGDLDVDVTSGTIQSIKAAGTLSGNWTCDSVKSVSAAHIVKTNLILSQIPDTKILALGKLTTTGWIDSSQIISQGNIGTVTARAMINSACFAGVADGITGLPTAEATNFSKTASIKSIAIKGGIKGELPPYFINSNIAAANILSASIVYPQSGNGGVPFGLSANYIKKLTIKTNNGKSVSVKELKESKDSQIIDGVEIRLY